MSRKWIWPFIASSESWACSGPWASAMEKQKRNPLLQAPPLCLSIVYWSLLCLCYILNAVPVGTPDSAFLPALYDPHYPRGPHSFVTSCFRSNEAPHLYNPCPSPALLSFSQHLLSPALQIFKKIILTVLGVEPGLCVCQIRTLSLLTYILRPGSFFLPIFPSTSSSSLCRLPPSGFLGHLYPLIFEPQRGQ